VALSWLAIACADSTNLLKARIAQEVPVIPLLPDDSKITTAEDACAMKQKIAAVKDKSKSADKNAPFLPLPGINIAFASTGLYKVSNILAGFNTLSQNIS
jgi:hypothetical protein